MGRAAPGPGQIMVVVDSDDSVEFARRWRRPTAVLVGSLVHTSPKQHRAGRLQTEVPGALGKRWGSVCAGWDATVAQLVQVWLRANVPAR